MCGILGQLCCQAPIDRVCFTAMLKTLTHRGPDGEGCYYFPEGTGALGHRRLSIIDLSENGMQPMTNEDGSIWITFNGEIYNYRELRELLQTKGHRFMSQSDTEVIIHGYEQWGIRCLDRLRGMFAFGIWDAGERQLVLARDPFGIKPLYYYQDPDRFIFASELKAIVEHPQVPRSIDIAALCDFFFHRYIPAPHTIWRGICKLPPASLLVYRDGVSTVSRYWAPAAACVERTEEQALEELDDLLAQSIKMHLVSDVPLGLLLSGGVDSSTIAYYMHREGKKATAFAAGFEVEDEWYNELPDARLVADRFSMELHEEMVKPDVWEILPRLVWFYDEPFGDGSMFPSYLVSRLARKYMKVALGGEGGDELFAGYNRYFDVPASAQADSWLGRVGTALGVAPRVKETVQYQQGMHPFLDGESLRALFHDDLHPGIRHHQEWFLDQHDQPRVAEPKRWQMLDLLTILPEQYLTKVDRASMAHSLEVRVPFLDKPLVEAVMRLPVEVYAPGGGQKKYLLRKLMRGKLPERTVSKKKRGFSIPLHHFFNEQILQDFIVEGECVKSGFFRRAYIDNLAAQANGRALNRLWQIGLFEAWYKRWSGRRQGGAS